MTSMSYKAPLTEQSFVLEAIARIDATTRWDGSEGVPLELVGTVLNESAKLAEEVFAPLNRVGDVEGARWSAGTVNLPQGFAAALRAHADGGWLSLAANPEWGGQGLPFSLSLAVAEQLASANLALSLNMLLTNGAIEALQAHASDDLKQRFLTRLVTGKWTGTMNLTEPQAGSDVGKLACRARPGDDGTWRITGSKIFISWGEHDLTDNIVHLVLARTPDAPAGTKGISLFIVPKVLEDGTRNDLRCVSIEHKLGIHASPTCTMSFGDDGGCVGYLVGEELAGMRAMFTMMNNARIGVGLQGVAVAERAYQAALGYARERVQGRTIIEFPDVRRMLLTMKALTEASRSLVYFTGAALDRGHAGDPEGASLADLLTPAAKAYGTDVGVEVASLSLQVFGGMGYVEETGVAQYLRDVRITPIYEGTNGIQALDLVRRKLAQGAWRPLFEEIECFLDERAGEADFGTLRAALKDLREATDWLMTREHDRDVEAAATPYLRMFALTVSGYLLAKQAEIAVRRISGSDLAVPVAFLEAKINTFGFYAEQILPNVRPMLAAVTATAARLDAYSPDGPS